MFAGHSPDAVPIKGCKDYLLDPQGRVFSLKTKMYRKPAETRYGAALVQIRTNQGKVQGYVLGRLVLETFVGPAPDDLYECKYINGDMKDCRVENLCWVPRPSRRKQSAPSRPAKCASCGASRWYLKPLSAPRDFVRGQCTKCGKVTRVRIKNFSKHDPKEYKVKPRCMTHAQWKAWAREERQCKSYGVKATVFGPCTDCLPEFAEEMRAQGLCSHPEIRFKKVYTDGEEGYAIVGYAPRPKSQRIVES